LKSTPDCNGTLMRWTNHLFFCFLRHGEDVLIQLR